MIESELDSGCPGMKMNLRTIQMCGHQNPIARPAHMRSAVRDGSRGPSALVISGSTMPTSIYMDEMVWVLAGDSNTSACKCEMTVSIYTTKADTKIQHLALRSRPHVYNEGHEIRYSIIGRGLEKRGPNGTSVRL